MLHKLPGFMSCCCGPDEDGRDDCTCSRNDVDEDQIACHLHNRVHSCTVTPHLMTADASQIVSKLASHDHVYR